MTTSVPDIAEELGKKKHVHRFTLPAGRQVISSVGRSTGGGKHIHEVSGQPTSASEDGLSHTHTAVLDGVEVVSGPSTWPMESGFHDEPVSKAMLPELIDPNHKYVFKTGEYGIYDYWYKDMRGNYWRYTNAPEDHEDFDLKAGVPILDRNQPMPHTAPQYFTPEGRMRHIAVPQEVTTEVNPKYNPKDPRNTWYEVFEAPDGGRRYVYLDADVRENPDLWVQYQLRVVDAGMSRYRKFAGNMFSNTTHPKDKLVGAILMLVDQGLYEVEELADALVGDLEFVDETVKLLGRKFVCDLAFFDFLTSLVAGREASDPLFVVDTYHGKNAFGYHYLFSVFKHLRVSPDYLMYWRASQLFARVMNRIAHTEDVPEDEVEGKALSELQRMFSTNENIRHMVDAKVRATLLTNYGASLEKALSRVEQDDFGVVTVYSDQVDRRGDEVAFSEWLHAEPMHDITPEEEAMIEAQLAENAEQDEAKLAESGGDQAAEPSEGAAPAPVEGEPQSPPPGGV